MADKNFELTNPVSGKKSLLPVRSGTEGPDVIDVSTLARDQGVFTYDPGFGVTAALAYAALPRFRVEAAAHRSYNRPGDDPSVESNADELMRRCGAPLLATVEYGGEFDRAVDWCALSS